MSSTEDYDKWQKEQQKEQAHKQHKKQYEKYRKQWEDKKSPPKPTTLDRQITMIEAAMAAAIAALTGLSILFSKANTRITDMDQRLDRMEVRIAEKYITRQEVGKHLDRLEDHMIRMESKLDQVVMKHG